MDKLLSVPVLKGAIKVAVGVLIAVYGIMIFNAFDYITLFSGASAAGAFVGYMIVATAMCLIPYVVLGAIYNYLDLK